MTTAAPPGAQAAPRRESPAQEATGWRQEALRRLYVVAAIVLAVPVIASSNYPFLLRAVMYPAYAVVLVGALGGARDPKLYRARALAFLGAFTLLCMIGLLATGMPVPASVLGLSIVALLGQLLLGRGVGLTLLAGQALLLVGVGLAVHSGALAINHGPSMDWARPWNWTRTALNVAAIGGIFVATLDYLIGRYEQGLREREEMVQRLELEIAQRRSAEAALVQSQKLELVGQLASGVAHDLNNALVVVMGWADALEHEQVSAAERTEAARAIGGGARRAALITRKLLTLGRRELRAPAATDLGDLVEQVARTCQRIFPAHVKVVVEAGDRPLVLADESQLEQVLLNLAVNARDAMPDGGTLRFTVDRATPEEADGLPPRDGYVALRVCDSGTGMDAATQARLFQPFFTTKADHRGTGLGLATAKAILDQSGGRISVRSAPGQGSTFTLVVPAAAPGERAPRSAAALPRPARPGEVVLVVDNESGVRQVMTRALAGAGFGVLEAEDGARALEATRRHRGTIHLLCVDGRLPDLPTARVVEEFRALNPGRPVLVCSAEFEAHVLREGIAAGTFAFLAKPFTGSAFVRKAGDVIDAGTAREG